MGAGVYNTQMPMGGGMNPFANPGVGYQNPNHNKPSWNQGGFGQMDTGNGPSMESWQKDYHEMGKNVDLNVPK